MLTEFYDGSVGIRPFRSDDVPSLYAAARESIKELSAWMVWCKPDYSIEDSAAFVLNCAAEWEKGEQYSFVIFDLKDKAFLGSVGLSAVNRPHKFANLGYWVRTRQTQRGVASAATRLIALFALEELGLNRLELFVPVGNKASQRVAEKAGARMEGVLRKRLILSSIPHDAMLYSVVAEDWMKSRPTEERDEAGLPFESKQHSFARLF